MSTYVVRSLDQAKLLTDPFKLKLLERFTREPVTTKQVADDMGEKAPRLYRHVDAMVDAGFLELVREKRKRGTIERYYKTVASRFEVDPYLFVPGDGIDDEAGETLRKIFRDAAADFMKMSRPAAAVDARDGDLPIVMRFALCASRDDVARLRAKLEEWVTELQKLDKSRDAGSDDVRYAGLLAFYPVPQDTACDD